MGRDQANSVRATTSPISVAMMAGNPVAIASDSTCRPLSRPLYVEAHRVCANQPWAGSWSHQVEPPTDEVNHACVKRCVGAVLGMEVSAKCAAGCGMEYPVPGRRSREHALGAPAPPPVRPQRASRPVRWRPIRLRLTPLSFHPHLHASSPGWSRLGLSWESGREEPMYGEPSD